MAAVDTGAGQKMKPIILEKYQVGAVAFLSRRRRALLKSPAGSGKTIISAFAIMEVLRRKDRSKERPVRVGWIANTREQCDQADAAIDSCPGLRAMLDIIVCCAAGAPSMADRELVIVDEAHHVAADQWREKLTGYTGALWLMSATPFGDDEERNAIVMQLCEGNIHEVPRSAVKDRVLHGNVIMLSETDQGMKEVIDDAIEETLQKRMARFSVYFPAENALNWVKMAHAAHPEFARVQSIKELRKAIDYPAVAILDKAMREAVKGRTWSQVAHQLCMQMGVIPNQRRNACIVEHARQHMAAGDTAIVLIYSIAHGEALAAQVPGSMVVHSKMGVKRRRAAIEGLRDGSLRCAFATSLLEEGFDAPRANVLIQASAGRSSRKAEQTTGRVLRAFGEQTHGTIYDFHDTFHPVTANQSKKRQAYYRSLGYSVRNESEIQQPALI